MAIASFFFFHLVLAGGRQADGAVGSFNVLEKITTSSRVHRAQEEGKFTVLFDSVSGREATSSRPSQWVLRVFSVSRTSLVRTFKFEND